MSQSGLGFSKLLNGDDQGLSEPSLFHVLQEIPICGAQQIPLLFVGEPENIAIHEVAKRWAVLRRFEKNAASVRSDLRVLGRLYDFWRVAWGGVPVDEYEALHLVWSFLDARHFGSGAPYGISDLRWPVLKLASVQSEKRSLLRYLTFLITQEKAADPIFGNPGENILRAFAQVSARNDQDFFQHLQQARLKWATIYGKVDVHRLPAVVRTQLSPFSLDRTPDLEEVLHIISQEPNPAYRALWNLTHFGGLRTSESLHLWQIDVLPPLSASAIGQASRSTVLVIVAHPERSTYLGDFSKIRQNRSQYLAQQYGLRPRNLLSGYRRAGWKNLLMTDTDLQLSEVFWSDLDQADDFADAAAELRHFHSRNQTSSRHPYFLVNLTKGSGYGEPIAYRKAYEAYKRASRRAGLEPSVNGRRIHGGRHLYKARLEALGLSPRQIQIAMRHRSLASQDDYHNSVAELRARLSGAHAR